jgi:hypothetical protein
MSYKEPNANLFEFAYLCPECREPALWIDVLADDSSRAPWLKCGQCGWRGLNPGRPVWVPEDKSTDAIEQMAIMLGKAKRQIELLRFLAKRTKREATLEEIDRDVHRRTTAKPRNIRNVRRQIEKTRDNWADNRYPFRLHVSQNTVRLIDADPT